MLVLSQEANWLLPDHQHSAAGRAVQASVLAARRIHHKISFVICVSLVNEGAFKAKRMLFEYY